MRELQDGLRQIDAVPQSRAGVHAFEVPALVNGQLRSAEVAAVVTPGAAAAARLSL